ncbi:MAG: DNA gyrase/topoisomerase IV subunit A, partial [Bacteroidales bacterium]|nr:DNA gyrase/topoisomerase IV subunit A [Bacteroidales bacterium]
MDEDKLENEEQHNGEDIAPQASDLLKGDESTKIVNLSGMYHDWFLDYASYVILERAVPHIIDGLKPVQRRILQAMKRLDDGRFNKVANIIGYTMQYHPHGDASIGDALVQMGQKDLLIETQGNWGNILTGDGAAAPRYIEARLSKFALDVLFNPKTTSWKLSYDGRNKEPVVLPAKFPILLAQGVEGIAVGLASKILPHNFNELIDASIKNLQGKDFELFPDFPTGGLADFSKYNKGIRGGMVKIRARINKVDKNILSITEIPFGKTTGSLIDSIIKATDKGKIKIRKIDDNTAENVEILIHLANGSEADKTIDALYAFTDCEVPISPNCCVIENDKPRFISVNELLKISVQNTVSLLTKELQIRKAELEEDWHLSSLEKIFIENKIYNDIEDCETWEAIIETINKGLQPFKKLFKREITTDDITKLTEIKIKRISKYDSKRADEYIKNIEIEIEEVQNHLENIIPYTINYYRQIKKKYGIGRDRKTEIRNFDTIVATKVVVANEKLYVNREEGFIGTSLRKDEYVCDCSDIDDILVIRRNGKYLITKISEKSFVGKDILYINVFKKNDKHRIYNIIYHDGLVGNIMIKRCAITGLTRDKEYDLTQGKENSKILYLSSNPNGEAEILDVSLKPRPRLKKLKLELDFSILAIKGKNSIGNIFTKNAIHKIKLREKGESTLSARKIWFNHEILRLNEEGNGTYLGEFENNEKILVIRNDGICKLYSNSLSNHFENNILIIEKLDPEKIFTAIYFDQEQKYHYIKRFTINESIKEESLIGEN